MGLEPISPQVSYITSALPNQTLLSSPIRVCGGMVPVPTNGTAGLPTFPLIAPHNAGYNPLSQGTIREKYRQLATYAPCYPLTKV